MLSIWLLWGAGIRSVDMHPKCEMVVGGQLQAVEKVRLVKQARILSFPQDHGVQVVERNLEPVEAAEDDVMPRVSEVEFITGEIIKVVREPVQTQFLADFPRKRVFRAFARVDRAPEQTPMTGKPDSRDVITVL